MFSFKRKQVTDQQQRYTSPADEVQDSPEPNAHHREQEEEQQQELSSLDVINNSSSSPQQASLTSSSTAAVAPSKRARFRQIMESIQDQIKYMGSGRKSSSSSSSSSDDDDTNSSDSEDDDSDEDFSSGSDDDDETSLNSNDEYFNQETEDADDMTQATSFGRFNVEKERQTKPRTDHHVLRRNRARVSSGQTPATTTTATTTSSSSTRPTASRQSTSSTKMPSSSSSSTAKPSATMQTAPSPTSKFSLGFSNNNRNKSGGKPPQSPPQQQQNQQQEVVNNDTQRKSSRFSISNLFGGGSRQSGGSPPTSSPPLIPSSSTTVTTASYSTTTAQRKTSPTAPPQQQQQQQEQQQDELDKRPPWNAGRPRSRQPQQQNQDNNNNDDNEPVLQQPEPSVGYPTPAVMVKLPTATLTSTTMMKPTKPRTREWKWRLITLTDKNVEAPSFLCTDLSKGTIRESFLISDIVSVEMVSPEVMKEQGAPEGMMSKGWRVVIGDVNIDSSANNDEIRRQQQQHIFATEKPSVRDEYVSWIQEKIDRRLSSVLTGRKKKIKQEEEEEKGRKENVENEIVINAPISGRMLEDQNSKTTDVAKPVGFRQSIKNAATSFTDSIRNTFSSSSSNERSSASTTTLPIQERRQPQRLPISGKEEFKRDKILKPSSNQDDEHQQQPSFFRERASTSSSSSFSLRDSRSNDRGAGQQQPAPQQQQLQQLPSSSTSSTSVTPSPSTSGTNSTTPSSIPQFLLNIHTRGGVPLDIVQLLHEQRFEDEETLLLLEPDDLTCLNLPLGPKVRLQKYIAARKKEVADGAGNSMMGSSSSSSYSASSSASASASSSNFSNNNNSNGSLLSLIPSPTVYQEDPALVEMMNKISQSFHHSLVVQPSDVQIYFDCRIGAGGYASVFEGEYLGRPVAAKVFDNAADGFAECSLMCKLHHRNVVSVVGVTASLRRKSSRNNNQQNNNNNQEAVQQQFPGLMNLTSQVRFIMLLELAEGTLSDVLHSFSSQQQQQQQPQIKEDEENQNQNQNDENGIFTSDVILRFAIQIAEGLKYLHTREQKILHLDLKASNILVFNTILKLTDFGISRATHSTSTLVTNAKGTLYYVCPELERNVIAATNDVYSYGIILLNLLTLTSPSQVVQEILREKQEQEQHQQQQLLPPTTSEMPHLLQDFLKKYESKRNLAEEAKPNTIRQLLVNLCLDCLSFDPKDRPNDGEDLYKRLVNGCSTSAGTHSSKLLVMGMFPAASSSGGTSLGAGLGGKSKSSSSSSGDKQQREDSSSSSSKTMPTSTMTGGDRITSTQVISIDTTF